MMAGQSQPPHYTNNIAVTTQYTTTPVTAYPQPTNPHLQATASSPKQTQNNHGGSLNSLGKSLEHATRKAGSFAENLYTHIRTGSRNVALSLLAQGTRVLVEGGCDRVFRQTFPDVHPGEKLKGAHDCYLSTSAGPVIGTLYISNRRVAFSSDQPLKIVNNSGGAGSRGYFYTTGESLCYYKVEVALEELEAVNASANRKNPAEKYVQLVARNGHEFWFMGFRLYDKALKDLHKAMQHRWGPPEAGAAW